MTVWSLDFDRAGATVTLSRDGLPVATGHGDGRDDALFDLWTTLADRGEKVAALHVAEQYRILTGEFPTRG